MPAARRPRHGAAAPAAVARPVARTRALPPPPRPARGRRWPAYGTWAAVLIGAWLERASVGLPAVLERGADALLVVATAALVMIGYRRSVRARLARSRASREATPSPPQPAETT
jgi:hypothetical protein